MTVIAFGTFDHFHAGHEFYLRQARGLGSRLVVVIARDATVKSIKGKLPDNTERERKSAVEASGIADKVVLGETADKYNVIRKYRPDVIALGYDQFTFTYRLKKLLIDEKLDARIVRLKSYQPGIYKTSLLKAINNMMAQ